MTARIFILAPNYRSHYNSCHEDFRREVCRQRPDSLLYGNRHDAWNGDTVIPNVIKKHGKFDYMLIGHFKHLVKFYGIEKIDIPKIGMPIDYFPWNHQEKNYQIKKWKLDGVIVRQRWAFDALKRQIAKGQLPKKLKTFYLPFSVNTKRFRPKGFERDIVVSCAYTTIPAQLYPDRTKIMSRLQRLKLKTVLRAANKWSEKFIGEKYVGLLNKSKMAVVSTDKSKSVLLKHFEIPACETLLLADDADGMKELGFKNEINYIKYDSVAHLHSLVSEMNVDEEKRKQIARRGFELVNERHSDEVRVNDMLTVLEDSF